VLDIADPEGDFSWCAAAGFFKNFIGRITPRQNSPCGVTLTFGSTRLFSRPEWHFEWMRLPGIPIFEGLLTPMYRAKRQAFGTILVMMHSADRSFDKEDA
jgi:hypothetical protein